MSGTKLKNIVLLILVVMNLFLAVLVFEGESKSAQYEEAAVADAIVILSGGGIAVERGAIARAISFPSQTVERDRAAELACVSSLLGEVTVDDSLGSILISYASPAGTAQLRSGGDFAVTLFDATHTAGGDYAAHARSVLKRLAFEGEVLTVHTQDEETIVTVRQHILGQPVFSCTALLTYEGNVLRTISGRRVVGAPVQDGAVNSLSPATLLLRFRSAIRETGDVCSVIYSITPGYSLSSTMTMPLRLTPVLLIVTDTHSYYQNAADGSLTRV